MPPGPGCRTHCYQASRLLRAGLAAALAAMLWAPGLGAQGPLDALRGLAAALRSRPVLAAAYVQEYVPAGMTLGEEERGTLTLAWPDRALFVTGNPPVRLMGLDGRRVRLVDLEVSSCEDHTLSEAEWERIPLVALLDPARAVERFGQVPVEGRPGAAGETWAVGVEQVGRDLVLVQEPRERDGSAAAHPESLDHPAVESQAVLRRLVPVQLHVCDPGGRDDGVDFLDGGVDEHADQRRLRV